MQLKGLVRIIAISFLVICLYYLSFTLWAKNYESDMQVKAESWVKKNFPNATEDDKKALTDLRLIKILDSTKSNKVGPFGFTTYKEAKEKELGLGLDLQGGMSVTMEVSMDALIHSLADFTKDAAFTKALTTAVATKANSGTDLVGLFIDEYKKAGSGTNLANFFINKSGGKIKFSSSDVEVANYLRDKSQDAFKNTTNIIRNRIDKFGVSSPTINPDNKKNIINIELAGAKDPERVRNILQSTANLQFFEAYRVPDLVEQIKAADKALEAYLSGVTVDTSKIDTTHKTATAAKKVDSTKLNPLITLCNGFAQPQQEKDGQQKWPPSLATYVAISDTAKLNSYLNLEVVRSKFPALINFAYSKPSKAKDKSGKDIEFLSLYALKTLDNGQAELEGDHVVGARPDYGQSGEVVVSMEMDAVGTGIWGKMTTRNVGKPIAIVLDNTVYSAPNILNPITEGRSQISGNFTAEEATDLSQILESGKLPAPARIVQEQLVGPTLGAEAIKGGAMSFAIAFGVIFILMLIYYNTAGWVANIALILNLVFTVGVLVCLPGGFSLTSAGIAGLVLTIGMAVDTNVIIFERIKEELNLGKSYSLAVNDGYKRSLPPILDAHVTSFLTAAILFIFGLGPVLGFATTQMLGIALSLFCGILVSRLITDIYADEKKGRHFEYFTAVSKKIFKHASYKFIEYRKIAYGISVVVLVMGIASFFHGFDEGVEFQGGRSYTVKFDKKTTPDEVRDDLKAVFKDAPILKTIGTDGKKINITTAFMITENGNKIDDQVEHALYNGLAKHIPAGTSFAKFSTDYKESSQTVLPSISADLKAGAFKAGIIAIIIICFYIFIRFRDWRYSVGTIVALLHDVFVTLAVFSFARTIVPFPLEIDQHFIAAVLTVIGFSMNDTVIVYDRIREDSRLYPTMAKGDIINKAINQTLSRTVMTSLTVFLTILILFIFGGEVTKGFAFAMLVGVITGTYSSIFVAAPILVDFAKSRPLGKSAEEVKS